MKSMELKKELQDTYLGDGNSNASRRTANRKEILDRKRAINELIKSATANKDHLASFPQFLHYKNCSLSVQLKSGTGTTLSLYTKQYIWNLLEINMAEKFGDEWATEGKNKRREMVSPDARYIFACEGKSEYVGFVQYRFTIEEGIPVLYLYEVQLDTRVQGKGLGKFLMDLIELVGRNCGMCGVLLTVQKSNVNAMKFYTSKMGYSISSMSPSRVDPVMGSGVSYEILSKTFDDAAKASLGI